MTKICKTLIFIAIAAMCTGSQATAKKKSAPKASKQQVIYTGEIAKKVIGYQGTTPLNITIAGGKIVKIEVLPNNETPQYLKRAMAKVIPQYEGVTVEQATKLKPDAATGATYTSEALIKNIQMGLKQIDKK